MDPVKCTMFYRTIKTCLYIVLVLTSSGTAVYIVMKVLITHCDKEGISGLIEKVLTL